VLSWLISKSYKDKLTPIFVSRQISQQHSSILDLERINTRTFSDLGPKTTSDNKVPFAKSSSMSQPPVSTVPTAAFVLGQQTFGGNYNKTLHYSIFGSTSTTTPDITILPPLATQLTPCYTPPEKFDGNSNYFKK